MDCWSPLVNSNSCLRVSYKDTKFKRKTKRALPEDTTEAAVESRSEPLTAFCVNAVSEFRRWLNGVYVRLVSVTALCITVQK